MNWPKAKSFQFEELEIGQFSTHRMTITAKLIENFAVLIGDYHPLHTDKNYCKANGFIDRIAHGTLLTSLSSRIIGMDLPGKNAILLTQSAEYLKPVYVGDHLDFLATILHLKKSLRIVTIEINVRNQLSDLVSRHKFSVKIRELLT